MLKGVNNEGNQRWSDFFFIRQNTLTNFDQRRGVGVLIVVIYKVRKEVFFLLRGGG